MSLLKTYTIATDISSGELDSNALRQELLNSSDIVNFSGISARDTDFDIHADSFTEASIDSLVLAHNAFDLVAYKQDKYNSIDYKTGALLSLGFTYDTKQFSLSANAQLNWSEIHSNTSEFPDPIDVTLINNDTYSLTHTNVSTFWTTAKDVLKGHLDSGRALKKTVFDAVDKEAVDLVIDAR